jgi:hypothetical protein
MQTANRKEEVIEDYLQWDRNISLHKNAIGTDKPLLLLLLLLLLSFLVKGVLSSLVLLLLSQWWTPPLRLQDSACSTFLMMCGVPSTAVFCRESIECCPGIVSRYFCKFLLTIPTAPIIIIITMVNGKNLCLNYERRSVSTAGVCNFCAVT